MRQQMECNVCPQAARKVVDSVSNVSYLDVEV